MSDFDAVERERWRLAASRTRDAARLAGDGDRPEWACFLAEQAAQLDLKGFLHAIGAEAWGHDLTVLAARAAELAEDAWPEPIDDEAARLSRHYIASRYPDAHPSGPPGAHYRAADATEALTDAEMIRSVVERAWEALEAGVAVTHPLVVARRADRAERIEVARRWASELATRLPLRAVVVVGSVARGDFNRWSDLDVLVVADGLPDGALERLELLDAGRVPGLWPVSWTIDELDARRARRDPIAREADEVGVIVWGALPEGRRS